MMNGLISLFAGNRVIANLLMALIFVAGAVSLYFIKMEVFPDTNLDRIKVSVPYPGSTPSEVEEGICVRIEEKIMDVEGIKEITSTAAEGSGSVIVEVMKGYNPRKVLSDVKTRVDSIDTFPEDAEEPTVEEMILRREVLSIAIYGNASEGVLKQLAEQARDGLLSNSHITQVSVSGVRPYELSIEVSEEMLRRHGLDFDQVAQAVRNSSLDLPGGLLKARAGEILLRAKGQAYRRQEFEKIVLLTKRDGSRITLGDVAQVNDGFEETPLTTSFNGSPAAMVNVFRVGDQNALSVAGAAKKYVEQNQHLMPDGVHMSVWKDTTIVLKSRLSLLVENATYGLILVFISLAMFLRFKLAFWVTLGIPISFFGAFAVMPLIGVSINMISLFALILVLGVVVDDAIVVGENVYSQIQKGRSGLDAAVHGTREVSVPVTFAVLTSIVAFYPMLNIPGVNGKIWSVIPLTVIPTLAFSLVESLLILPEHLSHLKFRSYDKVAGLGGALARQWDWLIGRWWRKVREGVSGALDLFIAKIYTPAIHLATVHRYATLVNFTSLLVLMVGLVSTGWIKWQFFPSVPSDHIIAELEMPQGTPSEITKRAVDQIEAAALQLKRELGAGLEEGEPHPFKNVMASTGTKPFGGPFDVKSSSAQTHLGQVVIEMEEADKRAVGSVEVEKRWRELTGTITGAVELKFKSRLMELGEPVNLRFSSWDYDVAQKGADDLKEYLAKVSGVINITDTFRSGKREFRVALKPSGEALGLTLSDLARQVRQGFYGEEAQRIQRGRDDIKVMVRYPYKERQSVAQLGRMRIRTPDGREVPFSSVATIEEGRSYSAINREDRKRAINVTADIDESQANASEVRQLIQDEFVPMITKKYPSLQVSFEGESREQGETLGGMIQGAFIAIFLIYALIATPLNSFVQGFVIMLAIPYSLIGAIGGHAIMGIPISVLSVCGVVALAGVAVNDGIVLIDAINRLRASGCSLVDAVREGGKTRFRPILLTSLTTFVGLLPLMSERSMQAQFLIPMAVSLSFGVAFATLVNLVLVPCGYLILEDIGAFFKGLMGSEQSQEEEGSALTPVSESSAGDVPQKPEQAASASAA